jgi:hypothetical protein
MHAAVWPKIQTAPIQTCRPFAFVKKSVRSVSKAKLPNKPSGITPLSQQDSSEINLHHIVHFFALAY